MQAGQFTVGDLALFVYYLSWVTDFSYHRDKIMVQRLGFRLTVWSTLYENPDNWLKETRFICVDQCAFCPKARTMN